MQIDSSFFKAYDIRGIYPEQISEDNAYALGQAYAGLILESGGQPNDLTIAVGSDMRISSPAIKERVIQALLDTGINVDDIGLVSTPTFYFATAYYGYDGGVQISASHNPKQWNGLKMVRKNSIPISKDTGIMRMLEIIQSDAFPQKAPEGQQGILKQRENVVKACADEQSKGFNLDGIRSFKIAIDASNGMGSADMQALFDKLPQCEIVPINFTPDGTFPNHEADPMKPENTAELCKAVVEQGCDLGIAPDGDADRIFIVDEKGCVLPQSILRGLMAQIELKEHPGATVAYDIRPGKITKDMIEEFGGKAVVTPVGHSLIKEQMIREGAIFGGESSGHYFYKLPYGTFEAPMILLLKLLIYISAQDKPFSEIVAPFDRYFSSGEINTKVASREQANAKMEEIKEKYSDGHMLLIDGVSVEYPEFWFNVRASNTEPLLRLTVEAVSKEVMEQKRDELLELIRS